MVKRIIILALVGWAGIIGFAWALARDRIKLCRYESECVIRTTATADNVLIGGLIVALVAFVVLALLMVRRARPVSHDWTRATPARAHRLD